MQRIAIAMALVLSGCASFNTQQRALIRESIAAGEEIVMDSLFVAVVHDMERAGQIDWRRGQTGTMGVPPRGNPAALLLNRLQREGSYARSDIHPFRPWWPFSKTKAKANASQRRVWLNVLKLRRDHHSLANTLVHERVHTFGQVHAYGQTRPPNVCDAAYVFGDLAEAVSRYRAGTPRRPAEPPCPALRNQLVGRRIIPR